MIALILAGGRGTRLQPWHAPKCLLPINGVPMIVHIIRHLKTCVDIKKVIVCIGHRGLDIRAALADASTTFVWFSDAGGEVPMGTRLLRAMRDFKIQEKTLIVYGDELADIDLSDLLDRHVAEAASMTFAATNAKIPGGSVKRQDKRIRVVEDCDHLVNIGFVVVEPICWDLLNPEDGLSHWINRIENVSVYYHQGRRVTVNSLADIEHAEKLWQ